MVTCDQDGRPGDVGPLLVHRVSNAKDDVIDQTGVEIVAIADIFQDTGGQPQR